MILAPGVEFFEDKHEYYFRGKQLSGVTGLIAKRLGLKMPVEFVEEHRLEGVHVHKAVQKWIETGNPESLHPGVAWLTQTFRPTGKLYSEVLVSDLKKYASAVDIVDDTGGLTLDIYDIKKGIFKREYLSWQLGVYKYLIEEYTRYAVGKCVCICMKDKEYYPIFPKSKEDVEKLLYG